MELEKLNDSFDSPVKPNIMNGVGKALIITTGGAAVALTIICAPFVSPALRKICLPYVPATNAQVQNVINILKHRQGKLVDIGSGDGRIVIAAAKNGFTAHGVELNPWLVQYSRYNAFRNKVFSETKFFRKNLWNFNLNVYNNIVIFGVEEMMPEFEKKVLKEVNKDTVIVACRFPLPNLKSVETKGEGIDTVWKYNIDNKSN